MDKRNYAILPHTDAYTGDSEQVYSRTLHNRMYGNVLYTDDNGTPIREYVEPLQVIEYDGAATAELLTHIQDYYHDLSSMVTLNLLLASESPIYATD